MRTVKREFEILNVNLVRMRSVYSRVLIFRLRMRTVKREFEILNVNLLCMRSVYCFTYLRMRSVKCVFENMCIRKYTTFINRHSLDSFFSNRISLI